MGINQICERFTLLTGISEDELPRWMPLIYDAQEYVKSILKDTADNQHQSVLATAVGTYAYYKWSIIQCANSTSSFKVGDVSVSDSKNSVSVERAELLWKECLKEIAPLTTSQSFYFKGVVI